jgi:hypothetical protein
MDFMKLDGSSRDVKDIWRTMTRKLESMVPPLLWEEQEDIHEFQSGNGGHEIFQQEVEKSLAAGIVTARYLSFCNYPSGLWYERSEGDSGTYNRNDPRCAGVLPVVIQNNCVDGNKRKELRAKRWDHWFVDETTGECPDDETAKEMLTLARRSATEKRARYGLATYADEVDYHTMENVDGSDSQVILETYYNTQGLEVTALDDSEFRAITPKESCRPLEVDEIDFTFATQVSVDRLNMMEHQCCLWGHKRHISIAVYTNNTKTFIKKELSCLGCHPLTTYVEVLDPEPYPIGSYPINKLRNIAMANVHTSHAM